MDNIDYRTEAIITLRPGCVYGETNGVITYWKHEQPQPTEDEIEAKIVELRAEIDVIVAREKEYNALNQFEMMYNDTVNGTTTWVDAIADIKARHPKL